MGQSRRFVPVRSRPNNQTVPILVSTGNATDRPAPRRRVSRRRVVAHSAGTGWRANDTTYRRGDGVFAARFPSNDLGLSRLRGATQKSSGFLSLELEMLSRSGDCLKWLRGLPSDAARRTSAAL